MRKKSPPVSRLPHARAGRLGSANLPTLYAGAAPRARGQAFKADGLSILILNDTDEELENVGD